MPSAVLSTMTSSVTFGRSSAATFWTRAHCSLFAPAGVSQRICQSPKRVLDDALGASGPARPTAARARAPAETGADPSREFNASCRILRTARSASRRTPGFARRRPGRVPSADHCASAALSRAACAVKRRRREIARAFRAVMTHELRRRRRCARARSYGLQRHSNVPGAPLRGPLHVLGAVPKRGRVHAGHLRRLEERCGSRSAGHRSAIAASGMAGLALALGATAAIAAGTGQPEPWQIAMQNPVTTVAHDVHRLPYLARLDHHRDLAVRAGAPDRDRR